MTAALVIVAVTTVGLAGVLALLMCIQAAERREWAAERRALVDRAIARHTGEVIALDRPHVERTERREPLERPTAVGL